MTPLICDDFKFCLSLLESNFGDRNSKRKMCLQAQWWTKLESHANFCHGHPSLESQRYPKPPQLRVVWMLLCRAEYHANKECQDESIFHSYQFTTLPNTNTTVYKMTATAPEFHKLLVRCVAFGSLPFPFTTCQDAEKVLRNAKSGCTIICGIFMASADPSKFTAWWPVAHGQALRNIHRMRLLHIKRP